MPARSTLLLLAIVLVSGLSCAPQPQPPARKTGDWKPDLDALVDAKLRTNAAAIPDEKNAAPFFRELAELRKKPYLDLEFTKLKIQVDNEARPWRPGTELDALAAYVGHHEPHYRLVEQALAHGQWHSSDAKEIERLAGTVLSLRDPLQMKVALLASTGDLAGAGRQAVENFRFFQLAEASDAAMTRLLLSAAMDHTRTQGAIHGDRPEFLGPVLAWVNEQPPYAFDAAAIVRPLFRISVLEGFARFPAHGDAKTALAARFGVKADQDVGKAISGTGRQILSLLEGHPDAWDRDAAIKLASDIYMEAIRTPVRVRGKATLFDEVCAETAAWPASMSLRFWEGLIPEHLEEDEEQELLRRGRAKLAAVKNPLGKHLATEWNPYDFLSGARKSDAGFQGYLTVLAIRSFRREHERLPKTLDELIELKVLKHVPPDPYGSRMRYSPEKGLVWSVGPNGTDDGGADPRDYVIEIDKKGRGPVERKQGE